MPAGRAGLAMVAAVTCATVLPFPFPPTAVAGPATAQRAATGCVTPAASAGPVTEPPWPQRRYDPDRLSSLATGAGVLVAVVDSGVDARHVQLSGRVLPGTDLLDPGGSGTVDCPGHGTAVASIIAARPTDGVAFRGLAPAARILPVRVSEQLIIDGRGSGRTVSVARFARAIRWSVAQGANVLNLSVVLYRDDPAVRAAVAHAVASDVVVVAAAGNLPGDGDRAPYPASYPGVLGVGAVGVDGTRAQFSPAGGYVDVVAPGAAVLAAVPGGGHREHDGTSFAAPFVSATAALLRQYRPDLSATAVVDRIVATADPAPDVVGSLRYGGGILNPHRALTETGPAQARGLPAATPEVAATDPAGVTQQRQRAQARGLALWFALGSGGAVTLVVLLATVLPRGARRRWRPAGSP